VTSLHGTFLKMTVEDDIAESTLIAGLLLDMQTCFFTYFPFL
jgi:hypothetical protein